MPLKKHIAWIAWLLVTLAILIYLVIRMIGSDAEKSIFLIGETTHGHYQIEMACSACHKQPFGGIESLQSACMDCHAEELKQVDDSHPRSKFTDPRNAGRVEILDARYCVTCHQEHNKESNSGIGLTLQKDYCFRCHSDVGDDRPTHRGLAFDSCASAGCHNYHDNTALYEDFVEKHLDEADTNPHGKVLNRNLAEFIRMTSPIPIKSLMAGDNDAPAAISNSKLDVVQEWEKIRHAISGVNCTGCHHLAGDKAAWTDKPTLQVCQECHASETSGFLSAKHGMRLRQDLSPMSPAMARLPMKTDSHDLSLDCNSCHTPHAYDTRQAAAGQCTTCHDDEHSRNYTRSSHYALWKKETQGEISPGMGVSCATCHFPRETVRISGADRVLVQHNQNANLRPNEKMVRSVCMNCHGLDFSINALADQDLIKRNFTGSSSADIATTDWVKQRVLERASAKPSTSETQE